jgi:hypothetical protein
MIPTRVEEEGRRGKRKEMMESLMQAHVLSHPGQYRPRRGGRVGKGRGGVAGVGIGSNAREEGSGKNGYVCGYLHSAQQDAMDVAPHNHTCTQGETCSKLGSRSALTFWCDSGEAFTTRESQGQAKRRRRCWLAVRTRLSWPRHVSLF